MLVPLSSSEWDSPTSTCPVCDRGPAVPSSAAPLHCCSIWNAPQYCDTAPASRSVRTMLRQRVPWWHSAVGLHRDTTTTSLHLPVTPVTYTDQLIILIIILIIYWQFLRVARSCKNYWRDLWEILLELCLQIRMNSLYFRGHPHLDIQEFF